MNILTAYYRICSNYLKEELPCIPKLKLTNAKTYHGKIYRKNGQFEEIALSKWTLDAGRFTEQEDIDEIIDTICHEFAHMFFWEHSEDHAKMTEAFVTIVTSELKIYQLENQLSSFKVAI